MAATVWANVTDILWPVGSIYRCLQNTVNEPAVIFGGCWEVLGTQTVNNNTFNIWYRYA